jgi:undecaprenyl diphosphate synthase
LILPKHLAIIMDGNGRWAKARGRARTFGHIKGARVAKTIITACADRGIENLTLYAFSSENWLRPSTEVAFLMNLLRRYLKRETENLFKKNIRFQAIGEIDRLPADVQKAIHFCTERTAKNTGLNLVFAISYGSRQEITMAAKKLVEKALKGELSADQVDEALVNSELMTAGIPDPDLIVRTSGEQRLSNFLLWQAAYSEFYFFDLPWPDFTVSDLEIALINFHQRDRRFGVVRFHENSTH